MSGNKNHGKRHLI